MTSIPAIPNLVLIPDETQNDYKALYGIATAYAHSGLLISNYGKNSKQIEFTFPAIVCSSFAIELFLKFFLMLERAKSMGLPAKPKTGHKLVSLWDEITLEHKQLIAGMFRNDTGKPLLNAADKRIELFAGALDSIGEAPFVKWRYVYEFSEITLMSHGAIAEVLDALGNAAQHVLRR